jgi:hypothetical protein
MVHTLMKQFAQLIAHVEPTLMMMITHVLTVTTLVNVAMEQDLMNVLNVMTVPTYTTENVLLHALKDIGLAPLITPVKDVMDLVQLATDQNLIIVTLAHKDYTSITTNVSAHVLMELMKMKQVIILVNLVTSDVPNVKMKLTINVNNVTVDTTSLTHLVLPAPPVPLKTDTIVMMKPTNVANVTQLVTLVQALLITVQNVPLQEKMPQHVLAQKELMTMTIHVLHVHINVQLVVT